VQHVLSISRVSTASSIQSAKYEATSAEDYAPSSKNQIYDAEGTVIDHAAGGVLANALPIGFRTSVAFSRATTGHCVAGLPFRPSGKIA
jgi:hypothetical protein